MLAAEKGAPPSRASSGGACREHLRAISGTKSAPIWNPKPAFAFRLAVASSAPLLMAAGYVVVLLIGVLTLIGGR